VWAVIASALGFKLKLKSIFNAEEIIIKVKARLKTYLTDFEILPFGQIIRSAPIKTAETQKVIKKSLRRVIRLYHP
jgi:hypothetical protein